MVKARKFPTEEHIAHHKSLHESLDELFADFILHHPTRTGFLDMPVLELLHWSYRQTLLPTECDDE